MNKTPKIVPFGTFPMDDDMVEIMTTLPDSKGNGYLTAELPDEKYGFKTAKITYPDLTVQHSIGFTQDELDWILHLISNNLNFIQNRLELIYA
ncbi:MAG: hypothetical protein PUG04_03885 [Lachnospiraceae bacterium]|nr:hypothetical protein [Lachnospiraceae bacterium]